MLYYENNTIEDADGTEYSILAEAGEYGWEWSISAILQRKSDGALFLSEDSGCSCNFFGDGGLDLTPIDSVEEGIAKTYGSKRKEALRRSLESREFVEAPAWEPSE